MTTNLRELGLEETILAYETLLELRPHLTSKESFVSRVNSVQRAEGYRLVAAFVTTEVAAVAVAGFRTLHSLAWGYAVYVDDLVTRQAHRKQGHSGAIMRWVFDEARRLGCDEVHLDSGVQRHPAHRFYINHGMRISSHHFASAVAPCPVSWSGPT